MGVVLINDKPCFINDQKDLEHYLETFLKVDAPKLLLEDNVSDTSKLENKIYDLECELDDARDSLSKFDY